MARTAYLSGALPRRFAHRGLHLNTQNIDENSIDAFEEALRHGATHIESDVHATKDQIAVLFHDFDLKRVAGLDLKISDLTLQELQEIPLLHGTRIPTLSMVLERFPELNLNLDIKSNGAIHPTVGAIESAGAHERVLVSSFSNRRRKKALKNLQKPVATSAASTQVLFAWLSHNLLAGIGFGLVVRNLDALQIPVSSGFMKFDRRGFISRATRHGVEVHFWTINEPDQMRRLLDLGASGIVTDRVDLFPQS